MRASDSFEALSGTEQGRSRHGGPHMGLMPAAGRRLVLHGIDYDVKLIALSRRWNPRRFRL